MSFLTRLRWLLSPSSRENFFKESGALGSLVLPEEGRQEALNRANKHGLDVDGRKRWDAWRKLIRIHGTCDEQLRHLVGCREYVGRAQRLKLKEKEIEQLVACFDSLVAGGASLDELETAINNRRDGWKYVRDRVRKLRPKVFVTHAFLMLSDVSGVGMASLVAGGVIGLGAIYTKAFYSFAIGYSVASYFTLDDLVNQGILVLRELAVALILIEVLFAGYRGIVARQAGGRLQAALVGSTASSENGSGSVSVHRSCHRYIRNLQRIGSSEEI